jgi:hypothetical protein
MLWIIGCFTIALLHGVNSKLASREIDELVHFWLLILWLGVGVILLTMKCI